METAELGHGHGTGQDEVSKGDDKNLSQSSSGRRDSGHYIILCPAEIHLFTEDEM